MRDLAGMFVKNGSERICFTKEQHRKYFPKRSLRAKLYPVYYVNGKHGKMYWKVKMWYKIVVTLGFPIWLILGGVLNFKQLLSEIIEFWDKDYTWASDTFIYTEEMRNEICRKQE